MTSVLILTMFLTNGNIITSPAFEYQTKEACEQKLFRTQLNSFDKPHIRMITGMCYPLQGPDKWVLKEIENVEQYTI